MSEETSTELFSDLISDGIDIKLQGPEQYNKGLFHIYKLIEESSMLYKKESYSTSVFLSITVIEEVPKLHLRLFARRNIGKKDPLRDHKTKHILGTNHTISMGTRLQEAIGNEAMALIFEEARNKKIASLRESALYFETDDDLVISPREVISREKAREMLLFAIESFDDNLVGFTNYSLEISRKTDKIFREIADS